MQRNSNTPRRGAWTPEEDGRLRACIQQYGEGQWHLVPVRAGLNRCRKSCRMRWMNYLKPDIKRGDFEEDEIDLILRMHKLLGNRWALIARRLPGRTANDIKNYWNTRLKKVVVSKEIEAPKTTEHTIFKPRAHTLSANYCYCPGNIRLGSDIGESSRSRWDELMDDDNGDALMLCNNGALEENVAQHIEANADNIDDKAQPMSPWSDLCPDDVDLSDLYEALHGGHPLI